MAIDNSFIIKKLQGLPEMFVIFSQSTKHPYVTCNEESFDDQIHIFSDAEAAHAYVVAKMSRKNPGGIRKSSSRAVPSFLWYTLRSRCQRRGTA